MVDLSDAALVVVDVQNDFCPGGALAVREGDQVVAPLNRAMARFQAAGRPVILTRDWHPAETSHFVTGGGPWPVHCVAGESGAAFHPALQPPASAEIVSKGADPGADGYSGFEARDAAGLTLDAILRASGVRRVVVGGLATDYCVRATGLDALRAGYAVTVLRDAVRGVDLTPGDADRALAELRDAGAEIATTDAALS